MKLFTRLPAVFSLVMITTLVSAQEPATKDEAPVPFPQLEHFAALWERSIFTTKDLPSPDAPTGPNFADSLSLSGTYEIDGGLVAVLVDRITSQVIEARIGSENEMGIKVRAVKPGATMEKTRIQLQKGDQVGWVGIADPAAPPSETVQRAVIPTQQAPGANSAIQQRGNMNAHAPLVPPATGLPPNPILPPPAVPASAGNQAQPAAPRVNDVPLPPP
ncbi:hypothetical protein [Prosthecobacter sp.]|uniref:hypothetical protein n=1 Tax=Prosthecobacter sp. TaxID=1965333 RepID=UPI0037844987